MSDAADNRVLFFQKPFSSGMSATKVLGALNFNNVIPAGSSGPPQFNSPHGVAVDPQDRVLVVDSGNKRIQIFNSAANINNYDTPPISITGLNQPLAVTSSATGFWVAGSGATVPADSLSRSQPSSRSKNNAARDASSRPGSL